MSLALSSPLIQLEDLYEKMTKEDLLEFVKNNFIEKINSLDLNDEETLTEHNANVVSSFMDHCKTRWTKIPDRMFETYFNA